MLLFRRIRTQYNRNHGSCYEGNNCGKLGAGDNVVNIYHACKYRSIKIAAIVLTIHKNVLYVKLPILLPDKGISISKAEAIPERIEEPTRKLARYKYASLMNKLGNCSKVTVLLQPAFLLLEKPLIILRSSGSD